MRANYKLQRLFLRSAIAEGSKIPLNEAQSHYLLTVLRKDTGANVLVFNGSHGEWLCSVIRENKKQASLLPLSQSRPQPQPGQLRLLFAPLKVGRLDYLVEKATEMGASSIEPVISAFTQNHHISCEKLQRWALEAAEQCGVLAVPEIIEPISLEAALTNWDRNVPLVFCDEDSPANNPLNALADLKRGPVGLLVGPEGGFSDSEREILRSLPFVTAIPLGPRILRADTAAIAALTLVQATIGDW